MKDKEKGNKIIAEFMGYTIYPDDAYMMPASMSHIKGKDIYKYDKSWSFLMPVVERISNMRFIDKDEDENIEAERPFFRTFGMITGRGTYLARINRFQLFSSDTFIESIYLSVVDFIKYYNENPKSITI